LGGPSWDQRLFVHLPPGAVRGSSSRVRDRALEVGCSSSRNESTPGAVDNTHSPPATAPEPQVRGSSSRNESTPMALHPFLALVAQPRVYSETRTRDARGGLDFEVGAAVAKQARLNLYVCDAIRFIRNTLIRGGVPL